VKRRQGQVRFDTEIPGESSPEVIVDDEA